jgi:hypothetical protein
MVMIRPSRPSLKQLSITSGSLTNSRLCFLHCREKHDLVLSWPWEEMRKSKKIVVHDEDLAKVGVALRRAAKQARKIAEQTNTPLIILLPIRRNPSDGSFFVKDEILLRLGSGKSLDDLRRLLEKINGSIIEGPIGNGVYRIQVPENSNLAAILGQAEGSGMERAEPNYAFPMPVPEKSSLEAPAVPYAPGFAGMPVGYKGDPGVYAGTSISAAYTANLISGVLSKNPDASISEILRQLAATTKTNWVDTAFRMELLER